MSKDTGGPAFPVSNGMLPDVQGMSLRDYFAAKAIGSALEGATLPKESWSEMLPIVAEFSYAMADAMLAERSKQ